MERDLPENLKVELAPWNDGKGIDLETWVGWCGSFKLAIGYTTVFWPKFTLTQDLILKDQFTEQSLASWQAKLGDDYRGIEAMINHIHLKDIHDAHAEVTADDLKYIGRTLKEIYEAKLAWEFPDRPCVVNLYEPEDCNDLQNYQITFWQVKHDKQTV